MGVSTIPPPPSRLATELADSVTTDVVDAVLPRADVPRPEVPKLRPQSVTPVDHGGRVPQVGDAVFYWQVFMPGTPRQSLVKYRAFLFSQQPVLPIDPITGKENRFSGRWDLTVLGSRPGAMFAAQCVEFSEEPRESCWTWE